MKLPWTSRYWKGHEDGFANGVQAGFEAANYLTLLELKRKGSTGDNLELPWSEVYKLFPAETLEKLKNNVYF